jgi:hypothetical protein
MMLLFELKPLNRLAGTWLKVTKGSYLVWSTEEMQQKYELRHWLTVLLLVYFIHEHKQVPLPPPSCTSLIFIHGFESRLFICPPENLKTVAWIPHEILLFSVNYSDFPFSLKGLSH